MRGSGWVGESGIHYLLKNLANYSSHLDFGLLIKIRANIHLKYERWQRNLIIHYSLIFSSIHLKIGLFIILALVIHYSLFFWGLLFTIHYKERSLFTNQYTPSRPSYEVESGSEIMPWFTDSQEHVTL